MDLQALTFYLLSLASTCSAWALPPIHFVDDPAEQTQECHGDMIACRMLVREFWSNDTMKQEYSSSEICRCRTGTCPSQWGEDSERTLKRVLKSSGRDMKVEMKFCQRIEVLTVCQPNHVALTLRGQTIIPQQVTSINCRCPNNRPLYLQKEWLQRNMERHQNFTCSMPTCQIPEFGDAPCLLRSLTSRQETTYLCDCPDGYRCLSPRRRPHNFPPANLRVDLGVCDIRAP